VQDWHHLHALLDHVIEDCIPHVNITRGQRSNPRWNSTPLADNLAEAKARFLLRFPAQHLATNARELRKSKTVQRFVTRAFHDVGNNADLLSELERRAKLWLPAEHCPPEMSSLIDSLLKVASKAPPQHRIIILKSICNGWTTSARANEETTLRRMFGCLMHPDTQTLFSV
jgi:hypothetical protein